MRPPGEQHTRSLQQSAVTPLARSSRVPELGASSHCAATPHEHVREPNYIQQGNSATDAPPRAQPPTFDGAVASPATAVASPSSSIPASDSDSALLQVHEQCWETFSTAEERRLALLDELDFVQARIGLPRTRSARENSVSELSFEHGMNLNQLYSVFRERMAKSRKSYLVVQKELSALKLQYR